MSDAKAHPVTLPQQLIWQGVQLRPDAPVYNMVATFHIRGAVDRDAFHRAFERAVERADALRSVFVADADGAVRREECEQVPAALEQVDLSRTASPQRAYRSWLERRTRRTLDLAACAYDSALVKLGEAEFVWYLNQHHLVSDAWSTQLMFEQVADLYARECRGEAAFPELAPLPRFDDYAASLAARSGTRERDAAGEHWRACARRASSIAALEFYGRAGDGVTTDSERSTIALGEAQIRSLDSLLHAPELRSLSRDITLFQIFLTLLIALVYRSSGQRELMVGTPLMNRSSASQRRTIGVLMEMFAVGVDLDPQESFATLYPKVRAEAMTLFRHGKPGASGAPLLRHCHVLLNFVRSAFGALDGIPVDTCFVHSGASEPQHWLRMQVRDLDNTGRLEIDLDCNTAVFSSAMRSRLAAMLSALLEAFASERERPIAELDLVPAGERRALEESSRRTTARYPDERPLHERIAAIAARHGALPAAIDDGETVTYAELDRRANGLATRLVARGVDPGAPVGIVLERSAGLIVAILAVLKAGGMYLPIDTDLPVARQAELLARSGARVAIGTAAAQPLVERARGVALLRLDDDLVATDVVANRAPEVRVGLDDSAYVLFTSGSTGTPKAVECTHRGVVNLLFDFQQRKPVRPGESCSLWTSVGFDVSVYEIFSALLHGGTLEVVPAEVRADARRYLDWLRDRDIVNAYVPPFLLRAFAQSIAAEPGTLALERLLVGVEPIATATLGALVLAQPGLQVINGYGPTEATICATLYTVPRERGDERPTPIGQPVRNCYVHVLDAFGQPVPRGVPGELFIGGDGLARGYLGRPDLTRDAFVADPFDPTRSRVVYRTGDRVRWRDDGNLEFLGRLDDQLKIRGHRVEPREIECALEAHPDVTEARVVAREDATGRVRLAAYLVAAGPETPASPALIDHLAARLPSHMIPDAYVALETFPLTASGKLDRAALPEPGPMSGSGPAGVSEEPPRPGLETSIARIWTEVLSLDAVGRHEHFIALGGDSVRAMQVAARASEAGMAMAPRDVFDHPTVARMARALGERVAAGAHPTRTAAQTAAADLRESASRAGVGASDLDDILAQYGDNDG